MAAKREMAWWRVDMYNGGGGRGHHPARDRKVVYVEAADQEEARNRILLATRVPWYIQSIVKGEPSVLLLERGKRKVAAVSVVCETCRSL